MDDNFIKFISSQFIKKSKVLDQSVCFCGSEKNFLSCCKVKVSAWIPNEYKESVLGLVANRRYHVNKDDIAFIPKQFAKRFFEKWSSCTNPYCENKVTVDSHIYGQKHIEKYLEGSKCKIRNFYDRTDSFFTECNTGKQITYKLFCESCEQLFQNIDQPDHFVFENNNVLLHLLRTQAYQYQFVRMDLALNHQFHLVLQEPLEINRNNFNGTPMLR